MPLAMSFSPGGAALLAALSVQASTVPALAQFQEGTDTDLTEAQIHDLRAWDKNTRQDLLRALKRTRQLSISAALECMAGALRAGVESSKALPETFFRYALDRAWKVRETLLQWTDESSQGVRAQELRILVQMSRLALSYYGKNIRILDSQWTGVDEVFALDSADLLLSMNESTLSAQAQFQIAKKALGYFSADLGRDSDATLFASPILGIHDLLADFEAVPVDPLGALVQLRRQYFLALTDLARTDTPIGREIRARLVRGKTVHYTPRVTL